MSESDYIDEEENEIEHGAELAGSGEGEKEYGIRNDLEGDKEELEKSGGELIKTIEMRDSWTQHDGSDIPATNNDIVAGPQVNIPSSDTFAEGFSGNIERALARRVRRNTRKLNSENSSSSRRRGSAPATTLQKHVQRFQRRLSSIDPEYSESLYPDELDLSTDWNAYQSLYYGDMKMGMHNTDFQNYLLNFSLWGSNFSIGDESITGIENEMQSPMFDDQDGASVTSSRDQSFDYSETRTVLTRGAVQNYLEAKEGSADKETMTYGPEEKPVYKRPYRCIFYGCTKSYTCSSALASHSRSHTGEKPFKCDFPRCNKAYATKSSLKSHKRLHTGEKPYECDVPGCGMRFLTSSALKYHKRVHTGEKPYICNYEGCTRRFSQSGGLKSHARTHTGEKPHQCEFCGKKYSQAYSLKKHISLKHGFDEEDN